MRDNFFSKRIYIVLGMFTLVFALFLGNLARLQLNRNNTDEEAAVSTVKVTVEAPRGEVVDRNGEPLVINRQGNSIVFDCSYFPTVKQVEQRVVIIDSLITLFENNGGEWIDELPLVFDESGNIVFVEDKSGDIAYLKSADYLNLNSYATAQNCFDALVERYSLQDYNRQQARKIISVCYNMKRKDFSVTNAYTFASDVSDVLVAKIKENASFYVGVDVVVTPIREYVDGTLAPHILGIVGAITAEEYAEKKTQGYGLSDITGKSGIELVMEDELRGENGFKTVTTDSNGNKTTTYTQNPVAGHTIQLTIDKGLQKVAQDKLAQEVQELQKERAYKVSGSVVAIHIKTGEVLACATYPSYDASTYTEDYDKLVSDTNAPLWNRALMSTYTPGSTIKLAVAMGGLEEGVIDKQTKVTCFGRYTYYSDYQPSCLGSHGKLDVSKAIHKSCNIFFYETSRLLGITALNKYFSVFGLGTKTGIELNEAEGNVDSVSYRESVGVLWTPGLTIQAGIGHGDNLFTPIQLCNYAAMVASKGTRYRAHFVKNILSYNRDEVIEEIKPEVLAQVDFAEDNWALVHYGTWLVGSGSLFKNVPAEVGAKTGTSTVFKEANGKSYKTNNGLLICFAPYNDPEIAICSVVEGAGSGSSTAEIASSMFEYYLTGGLSTDEPVG